jgi:proteic killer suppression protein
MIKAFADTETEKIYNRRRSRKLPGDIQHRARRKLLMIKRARDINDLRVPPGNRLEALKGGRAGQYSVRVNNQWRICFRWEAGDAYEVEITDYH